MATQVSRISSGVAAIDEVLEGGLCPGQVSEVYGCPGSGKTAFAMQVAAQVVRAGHDVVWLECSQCLPACRLREFIRREQGEENSKVDVDVEVDLREADKVLDRVKCLATPNLTSLLSLLLHSDKHDTGDTRDTSFITSETKLLVLDDLTTLYNAAFPPDNGRDSNVKKARILSVLANELTRLAATHNLSIVVLSKLTSKITKGGPAQLEAPFGDAWASACGTRILLYRNTFPNMTGEQEERWLVVQKQGYRQIPEAIGVPFKIIESGFVTVTLKVSSSRPKLSGARARSPLDVDDDDGHDDGAKRARIDSDEQDL